MNDKIHLNATYFGIKIFFVRCPADSGWKKWHIQCTLDRNTVKKGLSTCLAITYRMSSYPGSGYAFSRHKCRFCRFKSIAFLLVFGGVTVLANYASIIVTFAHMAGIIDSCLGHNYSMNAKSRKNLFLC